MGSAVSALYRFNRCVRAMLTWLVVAALLLTQVPYAHAGEAPTVDDPGVVGAFDLPDESSTDSATSEPKEQATEDAVAAEASEQPSASESSAVDVEDSASNDDGGGIHAPVPLSAASVPVTGFTELSTGGFLPNPGSARNLVIVVRFADDTTGDGNTGYNEPYPYGNGMRTQWERFVRDFNENDPNAYVKSSFREYFSTVSDGRYDVVTDFPQTNPDGTVTYITLPKTRDSYSYDGALVEDAVNEFNKLYPEYDGSVLDTNGDGAVDNVLIVPSVPEGSSITEADILWPHKADYPRSSGLTVGMKGGAPEVGAYNIISTESLDNMGVVAHEYLHSLGIKDYYRGSGDGNPVDVWDIMERSAARSWPLAITRNNLGWTEIQERSAAGTHTLYEPGTGREQAFAFKSPLSDTEYFVVEYRKKNTSVYDLDTHIGGTGLIVYRVNPNFADQGNFSGNDYVYVFRPGETGLGDARGDALNAQVSSKGARTSIGVSDLGADITQGALCYSDGRNSGIVIKATGETADSITFELTYPDYTAADLWDTLAGAGEVDEPLGIGAQSVQLVADGDDLYALIETPLGGSSAYQVKTRRGSAWIDLGIAATGLARGQLAVQDGDVYLLGADYADGRSAVVLRTLRDGVWTEAARVSLGADVYANAPTLGFVGSSLYVVLDRDNANVKLYAFEGGALVEASPALPVGYVTAPAVFELNGHAAVAYGDFESSRRLVYELIDGAWVERSSIAGSAHGQSVARLGSTTYVYQSGNADEAPSITSFGADGSKIATTMIPSLQRYSVGSAMVASGDRVYVAVIENGSANNAARVFGASASDLSTWEQVGEDAYKPARQVSPAVWDGKIVVGVCNDATRAAWVRAHELVETGEPEPPQPPVPIMHTATFVADGAVVDAVSFAEGDSSLSRVPVVPEKTGHSGTWAKYALGTSDLVIEAVYAPLSYTIAFKNWDGSVLSSREYQYDAPVAAPVASRPDEDGVRYAFAGWSPAFSSVCKGDATYTAQYRARAVEHVVVFKADGVVVDRVAFNEGDARLSRVPVVPEKAGYTGSWTPYALGSSDIVVEARYALAPNALTLATNAHVQNKGWIGYRGNGSVVGTTGSSLRMESIRVRLNGPLASSDAISVRAHVQNVGWMSGLGNDQIAGTTGRALRIEAMRLTLAPRLSLMGYRVYYRVHAQNVGWMGWAHDGVAAGTAGNALRLEAIQIVLVAPGELVPGNAYGGVSSVDAHPYIDSSNLNITLGSALAYDGMVHVQNVGNVWTTTNGARTLGTTGRGLRLEGFRLSCPIPGVDVTYRTHVQNIGWQNWVGEGALSGTQGRSLRLEALQVRLTGSAAGSYDVYYRTHVQNIGWTGWARNGQQCGSAGFAYRMEAIQVMIIPKGGAAPGLNAGAFHRR